MKFLTCLVLTLLVPCPGGYAENPAAGETKPGEKEWPLMRTHGVKINVDDMEKALSFYCGKLGFEAEDRSGYPHHMALKGDDGTKLVLNRVKKLRRAGPGDTEFSFTLQVNDLERAIGKMKSLGVEFGEAEKRKEGVGDAIFIKDPFGRRISLMHQTIVKVEPFQEPKLYNFGFLIPDMETGRNFYAGKLGFVVRSEKYLPLDLPLGHGDNTFAFMLHYRPGVKTIKSGYPDVAPFNMAIFETDNLEAAVGELKKRGVKFINEKLQKSAQGDGITFEDPFGNVSELLEVAK